MGRVKMYVHPGNQQGLARRKFLGPHSPPLPPSSCCQTHGAGQTQGWWQPHTKLPLAVTFASLPLDQWGTNIHASRWSLPIRRNLPPFFMGPRPAATAVSKRVSLKALWRLIFSPPESQQSALPLSTLKLFYYSSRDSFSLTVCTIKNRDKRCTYCMYN